MKSRKNMATVFFIILAFSFTELHAQSKQSSPPFSVLNEKKSVFKDGETVIAEVSFNGLDSNQEPFNTANIPFLFEEEFRQMLYLNRFGSPFFPNWKFSREKIEEFKKILNEKINRSGYLEAKVSVSGEILPDNQMRLIVSVERGAVARVSEIRFIGNKSVSSAELTEAYKERDDNWQIFRSWEYKYQLEDSAQRLIFSKGFLQAKIKSIVPKKTSDGYIVTVEVEEGVCYRIGDIKIDGVKVFSENEILEMLNQNVGDVADSRDLKNFFEEKLKRLYADKGYPKYEGKFDADYIKPKSDESDGTVNIRATINEGRSYKIAKIDFWQIEGEKSEEFEGDKAEHLRRVSGLKVNEIYSQTQLETALKNIDNTKEFEPTNVLFNVHLRVNDESGELDIEIVLEKKE